MRITKYFGGSDPMNELILRFWENSWIRCYRKLVKICGQEQVTKSNMLPIIVLAIHCLNKLF